MPNSIESYIHKKVVILNESDTVKTASRAMCKNHIGCILIMSGEGELSGIVTDRDLVCRALLLESFEDTTLYQIMTPNPITIHPSASIQEVIQTMKKNGVRRIPVVETTSNQQHEKCKGIISLDDLLASQKVTLSDVSEIVKSQVRTWPRYYANKIRSIIHQEQTYNEFIHKASELFQLKEAISKEMIILLLGSILKRLPYTSAAHCLAQFPKLLQDQLSPMLVGPDRSITAEYLINEVSKKLNTSGDETQKFCSIFWKSLSQLVDPHLMDHISTQLPSDLKNTFNKTL